MSKKSLVTGPEWPTLALVLATYAVWAAVTILASSLTLWVAIPALALAITMHSSLQHEVLHGHPLSSRRLSEALVYAPLGLAIPYPRFRDLHLAHHRDAVLTDPYDDPETNFMDPDVWSRVPMPVQRVLLFNNTLLGRMLVGPLIALLVFLRSELREARVGDALVRRAWSLHAIGLLPIGLWLALVGTMPIWAYALAAYLGLSILKIRTFLEHQAHERALGRTVIIEDRGPLAFLFLNNNFHAVHHAYPGLAWYALPRLYAARKPEFLRRNLGYCYASYGEILRAYLFRRKDPVSHPHWTAQ